MKVKKLMINCLSIAAILTTTGCFGQKASGNDKRPSIWISTFNGGYGREWLDVMVDDYNESHPENAYKISVRASKDEFNTIMSNIQAGTAIFDMFYSNSTVYKLIDGNYLEPLNDLWASKPDGTRTIEEMMYDADEYRKAYGDKEGNVYCIPQQESIRTFVYDHELFLKYGLLFGEDGNFISSPSDKLSAGKDGKYGTYDDGQPETEDQWEAMCLKCVSDLGYAFNYTGKFGLYTNTIYEMISAQYDGADNYLKNWTLDGTYEFDEEYLESGMTNPVNLNPDGHYKYGYMTSRMKGKKVALNFMDKYLACKEVKSGVTPNKFAYPKSSGLSYSHTDAQNDFIAFSAQNKTQKIGMLVEGDWWENEAKRTFQELGKAGYKSYDFRKHDYRYMTLPRFEGQKETRSVYITAENMYIAMLSKLPDDKKAVCKDFIKFTYQEKYLTNYTVLTGGVVPFDVQLSDEQKAKLSPFTKNFLELYQDKTNNVIINGMRRDNAYLTARGGLCGTSSTKVGQQGYYMILNGLYYLSAQEYFDGLYYNKSTNWQSSLQGYDAYLASRK